MDKTAGTRQRCNNGNKENAAPTNRVQSFSKTRPAAQFHQKTNLKKGPNVQSKQPEGGGHGQISGQIFLTGADIKSKSVVREGSKAPLAAVAPKPTPGMYKGKIVESKVACIWRLSSTVDKAQAPSSRLNPHNPESCQMGSRSVFGKPAHKSGSVAPGCPRARPSCPSATSVLAPLTSYKNPYMGPDRTLKSRPKLPDADKTASKPVSSIPSQNRITMETAEERRAKVAGWRASKGRTLKRPAMKQTKEADLKSQEEFLKAQEEDSPAAPQGAHSQRADLTPHNRSGPSQQPMDDPVNLSAPNKATVASPTHREVPAEVTRVSAGLEEGWSVGEKLHVEQGKMKKESNNKKKVVVVKESKEEPTPQREDPSVVKYSVTTTPYLQSMKKTIDAGASASRRMSSIKDLKFLTPVRRSCRIGRNSCHLPTMLQEHDPCVTSLAELLKLDDSPNAFIYRKNPALMEQLAGLPELGSVHVE